MNVSEVTLPDISYEPSYSPIYDKEVIIIDYSDSDLEEFDNDNEYYDDSSQDDERPQDFIPEVWFPESDIGEA